MNERNESKQIESETFDLLVEWSELNEGRRVASSIKTKVFNYGIVDYVLLPQQRKNKPTPSIPPLAYLLYLCFFKCYCIKWFYSFFDQSSLIQLINFSIHSWYKFHLIHKSNDWFCWNKIEKLFDSINRFDQLTLLLFLLLLKNKPSRSVRHQ